MTPQPPERPTRTVWRAFWSSRLVVVFAGLVGVLQIGTTNGVSAAYDPTGLTAPFGSYLANAFAAPLARWDSVWYLTIAKSGYAADIHRLAFFPLYPWLIRVVAVVTRSDLVAGVLISLVAFAVALGLLQRLVRLDFSEEVARTTVMLVAFCPMAMFFSAVYTEALFLALSVASIYSARRERWLAAGALGALAALSRNGGIALLLPLAMLYMYGPRDRERAVADPLVRRDSRRVAAAAPALPPHPRSGLVAAGARCARRLPRLPRDQVRPRARAVPV